MEMFDDGMVVKEVFIVLICCSMKPFDLHSLQLTPATVHLVCLMVTWAGQSGMPYIWKKFCIF